MQKVTEEIQGLHFSYDASLRDRYILERVIVDNIYSVTDELKDTQVIDIGAHIGAFSILAASKGAKVIAVEPKLGNFDLLLENIANNSLVSITPLKYAIAEKSGVRKIYTSDWCSGCGSLNALVHDTLSPERYEFVLCISLEDIFNKYSVNKCKLLKIDCEGAEEIILPEVLQKFSDIVDSIAVEFHSLKFFEDISPDMRKIYPLANKISPLEWKFSKYPES